MRKSSQVQVQVQVQVLVLVLVLVCWCADYASRCVPAWSPPATPSSVAGCAT
ncbi:hypothetical protein GUF57_08085 [Xanthomonas citri pv. citri]|nr:hypothetical protein [Xanthomonas citri pv. citri]